MARRLLACVLIVMATWASAASTIQGTVTNAAGKPLSSISVEAYQYVDSTWQYQASEYTDGSGLYTLSDLAAGEYRVSFTDWNGDYVNEWYDNGLDQNSATTIVVGVSAAVSNINASLTPASRISGTVTNSSGEGISLYVEAYRNNGSSWESWAGGYSDESGAYSIGGLVHGKYRIKFSQWEGDYATEWYNNTPFESAAETIPVPPLCTVSNIDALLGLGGKFTGTVTGKGGTPLLENMNVGVYAWNGSSWEQVNSTSTDSDGIYIVGGLPPGQCIVQFQDWQYIYAPQWFSNVVNQAQANHITAIAGITVNNVNAALSTASHIIGTVTGTNKTTPIAGINVAAYRWTGASWEWSQSDQTDGAGAYNITGLATGRYHVVFEDWNNVYMSAWYSNAISSAVADNITVGKSLIVSNINASLALGSHISGRVTATNGVTPLAGINVAAYRQSETGWEYSGGAGTESSGYYDVGGLSTGIYRVAFFASDGRYHDEYFNNQTLWDSADSIPITTPSTVENINATLAEVPPTSISGTVTGPDGTTPLKDIWVNLYCYNGTNWIYDTTVSTLQDGTYLFDGLNAGTNRVQFLDAAGIYIPEWYENTNNLATASNIVVTGETQITGIDATLTVIPETGISGTITESAKGTPLEGILVSLNVYRPWMFSWGQIDSAFTGNDGTYQFTGLAPDTYRLEFIDISGTYSSEFYDNAGDIDSATNIPVAEGEMATGKDAALDPIPATGISGLVIETGSGTVLTGITVTLYQDFGGWGIASSLETGVDGRYEFDGLSPGIFRIGFVDASGNHTTEFYDNAGDIDSATDINVISGLVTNLIDAALDVTAKTGISGRVTENGSGNPLTGIYVYLLDYDDMDFSWGIKSATSTGSDGTYEFTGTAAGTYRIQFYDDSGNHVTEYYDNVADVYSATNIVVTEGNMETGIDAILDLTPKTGISGLVTESGSDTALGGITVNLYQDSGGWGIVYAQATAGDGTYEFSSLPAGTYRIEFLDESGNHVSEYYDNFTNFDSATEVTVTDGKMETDKNAVLAKTPISPVIRGLRLKAGNSWEILFTGDEGSSYILQNKYSMTNGWDNLGTPTNCVSGTNTLGCTEPATRCFWRLQLVP